MKTLRATAPPLTVLASGSRVTGWAAALCGVHCALTPVLVAVAPALALAEGVERAVWAGTVLLGALMLAMGPAGRSGAASLTFTAGAALWGASLAGWLEPAPETVTSVAGSLTLAAALLWSARICRAGACPECADDECAD